MNGTKIMTAGLLLAALSISSSGIAQEVARGDTQVFVNLGDLRDRGPGNATVYDPETGQTVFIPSIVPEAPVLPAFPEQTPPRGDTSGGTVFELPLEIQRATLGEFLEGPHFSDLDIDLDAIPPAILNAEIDDLLLDPSMMAVVQSMVTDQRLEMLLDSLLNDPGQVTADMLETIQMPTGTGT